MPAKHITPKLKLSALALLGVLCLPPAEARCDLSMTGSTGLTINPTAQTPAPGGVRLQAGYYILGDNFGGEFSMYGVQAATTLRSAPLEISGGVTRLDVREEFAPGSTGDLERTGVNFGVKYVIVGADDPEAVRVAVGAGFNRAFFKNRHIYAVASAPVGHFLSGRPPITGHVGVRHDRYRSNFETSKRASIYGGVEIPIDHNGNYVFAGELQSRNHDFSVAAPRTNLLYSYALRYSPRSKLYSASFGIQRQGVLSDSSLFGYLGYNF